MKVMNNVKEILKQIKIEGCQTVYLNGFKESVDYVMSLSNIQHVGETKSCDGYSFVQCFETIH